MVEATNSVLIHSFIICNIQLYIFPPFVSPTDLEGFADEFVMVG